MSNYNNEIRNLKNLLLNRYEVLDIFEDFLEDGTFGDMKLRDVFKLELQKYLFFLAASDGYISYDETQLMNYLFDYDKSSSEYVEFIESLDFYDFQGTLPITLQVLTKVDVEMNIQGEGEYLEHTKTFMKFYNDIGKIFVNCDETEIDEFDKFADYISNMTDLVLELAETYMSEKTVTVSCENELNDVLMGSNDNYVEVCFLGEYYQLPKVVKEYLEYDSLLIPIYKKLIGVIEKNIRRDAKAKREKIYDNMESDINEYSQILIEGAEKLLDRLYSMDIYDVTLSEITREYNFKNELSRIAEETGQSLVDVSKASLHKKERRVSNAYNDALYSVPNGHSIFFSTNLFAMLAFSVAEYAMLSSAAKKAEREYQKALDEINKNSSNELEVLCRHVIMSEYYPKLLDMMQDVVPQLLSSFLVELAIRGMFDFDEIQPFNANKAKEMVGNIDRVADKKALLKKAFETCPFCYEIYKKCSELELLDEESYKVAEYLGIEEDLKVTSF